MVSPEAFRRQLGALGIPLKEGGDYYGYSLALGSAEVSLLNLTNAFRALTNGGNLCPVRLTPVLLPRPSGERAGVRGAATNGGAALPSPLPSPASGRGSQTACTPAIDPAAAFIVTDILADRDARARTFGTDSILATRFWTAVKTGTSKDMRDNWAVGSSARYTVGVWVGNASGAAMWDVSGTSGAAPVWAALMRHLHARTPSRAPAPPAGLVRQPVRFGDTLEAARDEWFLPGTEQTLFAIDSGAARASQASAGGLKDIKTTAQDNAPRISAPQDGTILALDPDIPPARQRLTLLADAGGAPAAQLRWWIDDRPIGSGARAQWLPWPGRHVVQLRDAQGRVHDERRIQVRGAVAKTAPPRKPP